MIPGRDHDTFGVGFWYIEISNRLPNVRDRLGDTNGGEIYYNVALTPWLHLTPNLQVISPAQKRYDPAVVTGGRLMVSF